jgi:hypothetical protein
MKEIWKDIEGYDGDYQVSNFGNVKSFKNNKHSLGMKSIILKTSVCRGGYLFVTLCKNGLRFSRSVSGLVARAFISNAIKLETINHKNEIKTDNRAENLEWMIRKNNVRYSAKLNPKIVLEIRDIKLRNPEITYISIAKQYGVTDGTIRQIYHRKIWEDI